MITEISHGDQVMGDFNYKGKTGIAICVVGVWKSIKVATEICVDDFFMTSIDLLIDVSHCVELAAVLPIGVPVPVADRPRKSGREPKLPHFR